MHFEVFQDYMEGIHGGLKMKTFHVNMMHSSGASTI